MKVHAKDNRSTEDHAEKKVRLAKKRAHAQETRDSTLPPRLDQVCLNCPMDLHVLVTSVGMVTMLWIMLSYVSQYIHPAILTFVCFKEILFCA